MDVPEKQKNDKKAARFQVWYPQYDLDNLPATNSPAANTDAPVSAAPNTSTNSVNTSTNTGTSMNTNAAAPSIP
jgi:hypothetical protein